MINISTAAGIREYQVGMISAFVGAQNYTGVTLDYGCGVGPYRPIVERDGEWVGYDRGSTGYSGPQHDVGPDKPLGLKWDTILCTQVLQFIYDPQDLINRFNGALTKSGQLVLTYATNWPEVQNDDLVRFTKSGVEALLSEWKIEQHSPLGSIPFGDQEKIVFGYGVVARLR